MSTSCLHRWLQRAPILLMSLSLVHVPAVAQAQPWWSYLPGANSLPLQNLPSLPGLPGTTPPTTGTSAGKSAATLLPAYNVAPSGVTVAGISSGGFMAVQLQVAYSQQIFGAAIFAGGPYYCAQGSVVSALGYCESGNGIPLQTLIDYTNAQATAGKIDPGRWSRTTPEKKSSGLGVPINRRKSWGNRIFPVYQREGGKFLAVLLGFLNRADGKNSRRRRLKSGHYVNDVNVVGASCCRHDQIAFFRKPRDRRLIFRDKGRVQRVTDLRSVARVIVAGLAGGGSENARQSRFVIRLGGGGLRVDKVRTASRIRSALSRGITRVAEARNLRDMPSVSRARSPAPLLTRT
jgi:hypothetical protein